MKRQVRKCFVAAGIRPNNLRWPDETGRQWNRAGGKRIIEPGERGDRIGIAWIEIVVDDLDIRHVLHVGQPAPGVDEGLADVQDRWMIRPANVVRDINGYA